MTEPAHPSGMQVAVREQHLTPLVAFNPAAIGLPTDFGEQLKFAEFVAGSDLVPKALQGKPANCFLVMQKAVALNLPWDVAMSGIHIIDNKVTCGAKLLRMLIRKAGHDFDPHTITDKEARGTLTLLHRPNKPIEVVYTIAEAQTAGLTNKAVWKNYVKSMLVAALSRRAVDWHCPEVAMGLDLSDDTLAASMGVAGDEAGTPVRATAEVVDQAAPDGAVPAQRNSDDAEKRAQALEVLEEAAKADQVSTLTRLGKDARTKHLLEQVVDEAGTTLKDALMARMREVESGQTAQA